MRTRLLTLPILLVLLALAVLVILPIHAAKAQKPEQANKLAAPGNTFRVGITSTLAYPTDRYVRVSETVTFSIKYISLPATSYTNFVWEFEDGELVEGVTETTKMYGPEHIDSNKLFTVTATMSEGTQEIYTSSLHIAPQVLTTSILLPKDTYYTWEWFRLNYDFPHGQGFLYAYWDMGDECAYETYYYGIRCTSGGYPRMMSVHRYVKPGVYTITLQPVAMWGAWSSQKVVTVLPVTITDEVQVEIEHDPRNTAPEPGERIFIRSQYTGTYAPHMWYVWEPTEGVSETMHGGYFSYVIPEDAGGKTLSFTLTVLDPAQNPIARKQVEIYIAPKTYRMYLPYITN